MSSIFLNINLKIRIVAVFFWTLKIPYSREVPNNKTLSVFITFLLSKQTWEMSSIFLNNNQKCKHPDCCWFFVRTLKILTDREGPSCFYYLCKLERWVRIFNNNLEIRIVVAVFFLLPNVGNPTLPRSSQQ